MAQFRATVHGAKGLASRLGTKASGITTVTQSWQGEVEVEAYHAPSTGQDYFCVTLRPHSGTGGKLIYNGPADGWK